MTCHLHADRARRARRLFASDASARIASAVLTSLLGIGVLHSLLAPDDPGAVLPAATIEVVLLAPPVPLPLIAPASPDAAARELAPRHSTPPPQPAPETPTDTTQASPDTPTRLDYGALLGETTAIEFATRPPGQRDAYGTPFEMRPERFRMRRQVSPEDVVRGFAQLVGLWPPGYTDSPCPAIRGLIATTPEVPSPLELALLQDAVLAREQFCS